MIYDPARRKAVLFGGRSQRGYLNDTWEWDGIDWKQVRTSRAPSPRATSLAYDARRGRVVLFGGQAGQGDTWEYDGKTWTQIQTRTRPKALWRVAMVYNAASQRVVVFGGSAPLAVDATWECDGVDWVKVQVTRSPQARWSYDNVVYDSGRRRLVMFGGSGRTGALADTWEYTQIEPLVASPSSVSIATGGTQTLTLDAGPARAGRLYWVFGWASGVSPGVSLNGLRVPLNPDAYTSFALANTKMRTLSSFRDTLDASGKATASGNVPANLPVPSNLVLHHAFVVYDAAGAWHMVSNATSLTLR